MPVDLMTVSLNSSVMVMGSFRSKVGPRWWQGRILEGGDPGAGGAFDSRREAHGDFGIPTLARLIELAGVEISSWPHTDLRSTSKASP
jgi:hypothetical protein